MATHLERQGQRPRPALSPGESRNQVYFSHRPGILMRAGMVKARDRIDITYSQAVLVAAESPKKQ